MISGRDSRLMPISDIKARMPPSPSLSMRMASSTYFSVVTTISVQTRSDSMPRVTARSAWPPASDRTVLSVYSGLVPISPKTMPSAPRLSAARPWLVASGGLRDVRSSGSPTDSP